MIEKFIICLVLIDLAIVFSVLVNLVFDAFYVIRSKFESRYRLQKYDPAVLHAGEWISKTANAGGKKWGQS